MRKKLACVFGAFFVAASVAILSPTQSLAQGAPTVSMVTLQTVPGENGQQMVITPRGKAVPLPGPGVDASAVNIYMGSQGGYWYTDKTGQNVDLTSAVQYYQRMQAQNGGAGYNGGLVNVPQYAPEPVVNNYYNQNGTGSGGGSSSSGGSGAGTAVMAGLGAATGAAVTNAIMGSSYNSGGYYHGVPYGMPVYYGAHNNPYYTDRNGNNVYVNNSKEYNKSVAASANVTQNNINNQHINAINDQQKWYQNQAKNHTDTFNNWQQNKASENPFVHPDAQNQWQQHSAQAGAGSEKQGRFGRHKDGGTADGEGNRLGNRDGDSGRFGNRGSDGGGGGGRFSNRGSDGGGGGRFSGGGFRGRRGR